MAGLKDMPSIQIAATILAPYGEVWKINGEKLGRTSPFSSSDLGRIFDTAVGEALAVMLGNIPIDDRPNANALKPSQPDCVEVGPVRVIGGVRPQNFDVGYRPDGIRFAFDSKTLNDAKSVGKNWQNMVNDLATEATTVHSRFPHTVVAFMVIIPAPCISEARLNALVQTLERLTGRGSVEEPLYQAEAIALVLWDPATGEIASDAPKADSPLRLEYFSRQVSQSYTSRYKGLPPHAKD